MSVCEKGRTLACGKKYYFRGTFALSDSWEAAVCHSIIKNECIASEVANTRVLHMYVLHIQ